MVYKKCRYRYRFAKKRLDDWSFYGGVLHVCYAPEYETVQETREKLQERRRTMAAKIRQHGKKLWSLVGMGTNTRKGIGIFGINIRIYSNVRFGRSYLSIWEMVSLSRHQTYPDTGTVHDQFEVRKDQAEVSVNCLELESLYVNMFLDYLSLMEKTQHL